MHYILTFSFHSNLINYSPVEAKALASVRARDMLDVDCPAKGVSGQRRPSLTLSFLKA